MTDVIIIGGGIAGLAAAYELQRAGVPFTLLEAGSRFGGVILTEHVEGFTIDGGPDSLLAQKPAAIELCRQLGLADRLIPTTPPRTAFIVRGGRLHPLPESSILGIPTRLSALAASSLFSVRGKARMAAELFIRPRAAADADESIGSFVGRRFGREAVEYLAEPLLAGIHAGDVMRLSMRSLFPRLMDAEITHRSVIRAFRRLGAGQRSADGAFRSLRGGIGELVDALCAALPASSLRLDAPARTLRPGDGWTVGLASGESIRARAVIIAAPAFAAADLVRPLDEDLANLCAGVQYASTVTIALGYPRHAIPHPLAGSGFVVPRTEPFSIMAGTWVSSKWAERAPEGQALLRVFVGGARDPDAIGRTKEELVTRARADLERLLGIVSEPWLTRVYRWQRASPQHDVGHLERMSAIEAALGRHRGLFMTGSGFRAPGIPDCVADARATAAAATKSIRSYSLT